MIQLGDAEYGRKELRLVRVPRYRILYGTAPCMDTFADLRILLAEWVLTSTLIVSSMDISISTSIIRSSAKTNLLRPGPQVLRTVSPAG